MSFSHSTSGPDVDRPREYLLRELADLISRVAAEEKRSRELGRELASLKSPAAPQEEHRSRSLFYALREGFFLGEVVLGGAGGACDLRLLEANPAFGRITGLDPARVVGRTARQLFPESEPVWAECLRRVALGGEPLAVEAPLQALGLWLEAYVFRPAPGQVAMLFIDRTRRHRAEAALKESEAQFRELADSLPQLVWIAGPDGKVTYYNRRYREFGGIRPAGDTWEWAPVLHPDDAGPTVEAWKRAVAGGTVYEIEHRIRLVDGSYRWYLSRGFPTRDAGGRIVRWYGTATDIQSSKEVERQLALAKAEAERANQAKSEFLSHMSHEIRTPLSAVVGLSEVLAARLEGEDPNRQFVALLQESARSLLTIVGDILDLSRIEAGKVELSSEEVALAPLLERVVESHRPIAEKKGLSLSVEVRPEVPQRVVTDPELLSQVLRNLLSNALKYTEEGLVKVHVGVEMVHEQWTRLCFEVADSGIGIPAGLQHRLFQNFSRIHPWRLAGAAPEGTGLGLAISRKLVELLGGEIGVESEEGVGSTFWFTVPLGLDPAGLIGPSSVEQSARPRNPLAALPPLEVLVVEDNPANRTFLQAALQDAGHSAALAESGPQALEEVLRRRFDLVLMDIQLPGMDGLETARRIRALAGSNGRPSLIALTAYSRREDEESARQAGMDGYISKPVDFRRLAGEIRRVLPGKSGP